MRSFSEVIYQCLYTTCGRVWAFSSMEAKTDPKMKVHCRIMWIQGRSTSIRWMMISWQHHTKSITFLEQFVFTYVEVKLLSYNILKKILFSNLVSDCMSPFLYWYIGRRYNNWHANNFITSTAFCTLYWVKTWTNFPFYCRVPLYKDNGL